jgi:thioredoxin reductase
LWQGALSRVDAEAHGWALAAISHGCHCQRRAGLPLEAKLCAGEEIAIIGGGNSAGQAAVFLANHASRVHMLIPGEGLAASSVARRLSRETGQSPAKAVEHLRVEAARVLIEQGRLSTDAIAEETGFRG